jgi:outer membrane protein
MKFWLNSILLVSCLSLLSFQQANAQKLGHIDYEDILSKLPDVKRADSEIDALRKQFTKQGQGLQKRFQEKYQETMAAAESGKLTDAQKEQASGDLQKMQADLEKFSANAEEQIGKRRQTLLKPILNKIENAVKQVAKEKGLAYVMAMTTLLYYDDGINVTADVKAKLGLQ